MGLSPCATRRLRRLLETISLSLRHWRYSQFADPANEGKVFPTWLDSYREPADAQLPSTSYGLQVVFKNYTQNATDPAYIRIAQPEKQVCSRACRTTGRPWRASSWRTQRTPPCSSPILSTTSPLGSPSAPSNPAPAPAPFSIVPAPVPAPLEIPMEIVIPEAPTLAPARPLPRWQLPQQARALSFCPNSTVAVLRFK